MVMLMFMLKIMSGEDRPDSDVSKSFKGVILGDGMSFEFSRKVTTETALLTLTSPDGSHVTMDLAGNAYIVSNTGKTVASFAYSNTKLVDAEVANRPTFSEHEDRRQRAAAKPLNSVSVSAEAEALTSARILWLRLHEPKRLDRLRVCRRADGSLVVNDQVDTVRQLDQWGVPNTYGELLN
jgi:hypothetical protein